MIQEINATEFDQVAQSNDLSVLKIGAGWCAACKAIQPAIEGMAESFKDVRFYDMDADKNTDFVLGLGVKSLPTFVFLKAGEKLSVEKGLEPASLKNRIETLR